MRAPPTTSLKTSLSKRSIQSKRISLLQSLILGWSPTWADLKTFCKFPLSSRDDEWEFTSQWRHRRVGPSNERRERWINYLLGRRISCFLLCSMSTVKRKETYAECCSSPRTQEKWSPETARGERKNTRKWTRLGTELRAKISVASAYFVRRCPLFHAKKEFDAFLLDRLSTRKQPDSDWLATRERTPSVSGSKVLFTHVVTNSTGKFEWIEQRNGDQFFDE